MDGSNLFPPALTAVLAPWSATAPPTTMQPRIPFQHPCPRDAAESDSDVNAKKRETHTQDSAETDHPGFLCSGITLLACVSGNYPSTKLPSRLGPAGVVFR